MRIENLQKPKAAKTRTKAKIKVKPASSPSFFYSGMALLLMLFAFLGFWPSYFSTILPSNEMSTPLGGVLWVIHLHAVVFVGWLLLLLVETMLIARKRIRIHMKIGHYGLFLGAAVFLTGLLVLALQNYAFISSGEVSVLESTVGSIGVWMQMVNFAVFLYLGYRMRRKPEYHKRYMLFATIALMPAALVRLYALPLFFYLFGYFSLLIFSIAIIGIVMGHDFYRLKRIHRATLIGSALFLVDVALLILGFQ